MVDGTTAALTPSAVSLASTWDVNVVAGIGHLLATEMRDKKADILLAPTGEKFRSTRFRDFDANSFHSVSPPFTPWWEEFRIFLRG